MINNLEINFDKDFIYEKFPIEENKRSKVLIFKPIDLITIKLNAINEKYTKIEMFENDFKHLKKIDRNCVKRVSNSLKLSLKVFGQEKSEIGSKRKRLETNYLRLQN